MNTTGNAGNYLKNQLASALLEEFEYAYFETDLKGHLTFVNRLFCEALDYSQAELTGLHYRHITAPGQARQVFQVFNQVFQSGHLKKGIEYPMRKKDGTLSFAEGSVNILRDGSGDAVGFSGIMHDISQRKQEEVRRKQAQQLVDKELEIGRQIQASFLPKSLPQPDGWEVGSRFQAARQVAGDFYDAFWLGGNKRLGLVIADVCDKGVGAALFMALFRSLLRAFADQHYSLGWMDVLSGERGSNNGELTLGRRRALLSSGAISLKKAIDLTNTYITLNHGETNMFATVFFAVLDPASGSLIYINAGHEPPLVLGEQGLKARLQPTGPAVGLLPDLEFGLDQIDLQPGDTLLAYTDGVTDARNPAGEPFGEKRLLELTENQKELEVSLLDRIHAHLNDHIADTNQYDDITLLSLRRKS